MDEEEEDKEEGDSLYHASIEQEPVRVRSTKRAKKEYEFNDDDDEVCSFFLIINIDVKIIYLCYNLLMLQDFFLVNK